MANSDMRRRLATMLGDCPVTISGVPPITTTRRRLLSLKAFGGIEQNGTPTPDTPVDIVSNNGVLKLSPNLFNIDGKNTSNGYVGGKYLSNNGSLNSFGNASVSEYIIVSPETDYYYIGIPQNLVGIACICWYDSSKSFLSSVSANSGVKTSPQSAAYCRLSYRIDTNVSYMFTKGDTAVNYTPYGIYADGTVETVDVSRYYDSADGQGTFVSPSTSTTTRVYKIIGKLQAGHYKIKITGNFEFILQYKDTIDESPTTSGNIGTWTTEEEFDITDTSLFYGIAIRHPGNTRITPSDFNGTITLMDTNNVATDEMLLKVGDYKDEQEILSGAITRNVGVKVFDGSETIRGHGTIDGLVWEVNNNVLANNEAIGICSHYNFTTVSIAPMASNNFRFAMLGSDQRIAFKDTVHASGTLTTAADNFKAYLAAQYAAGTPVIVVYPLATPTTETVEGQTVALTSGTNVIDITQASLNNLELEVKAK